MTRTAVAARTRSSGATARSRPLVAAALALLLGLLLLGGLAGSTRTADAHAFLERSDPQANAVLPTQPTEVRLWFTEPLEPDYSRAQLFDAAGVLVPTDASRIGANNELLLTLPQNLPTGTYSVQWRNISTADGHPQQGYLPFTIGGSSDVVTPVPPAVATFDAAPTWLQGIGRWLSLLGSIGVVGALACWVWVLRPALRGLEAERREQAIGHIVLLVVVLGAVGLAGNLLHLIVQATATGDGWGPGVLLDVATGTRFGTLWIVRVALLVALVCAVGSRLPFVEPLRTGTLLLFGGLSAAALLPFSLNSHASALGNARPAALAADWLHMGATSVWIGGLLVLLVVLLLDLRGVDLALRRATLAEAIPRFTTLAISSVLILAATGFYSAWLHVGNLVALRETDYGRALIVKLALLVVVLVLGALNMRWVGPRMRDAARQTPTLFGRTLAVEAALAVGLLLVVGIMTSLPTARDTIKAESDSTTFHLSQGNIHAVLHLSPGAVGANRYTADVQVDGDTNPLTVLLRVAPVDASDLEGVREIALQPTGGVRYEASGTDLSVTGEWSLELIVRQTSGVDTRFNATYRVANTPPAQRVPGDPPLFRGPESTFGVLFAALALVLIVVAARTQPNRQERMITFGISGALLLGGGLVLLANLTAPTNDLLGANPTPRTAASVSSGSALFQANCTSCHGTDARGDGPLAPTLSRPPADLHAAHVDDHSDADMAWWIMNGIQPVMPAFGDELTTEQVWDLVNYVRSLRQGLEQ